MLKRASARPVVTGTKSRWRLLGDGVPSYKIMRQKRQPKFANRDFLRLMFLIESNCFFQINNLS